MTSSPTGTALLHLVFGGELVALDSMEFRDTAKLDIVGIFPSYAAAEIAWRSKAQASVDSAMMRYFIVHLHRFLEPGGAGQALSRHPPAARD